VNLATTTPTSGVGKDASTAQSAPSASGFPFQYYGNGTTAYVTRSGVKVPSWVTSQGRLHEQDAQRDPRRRENRPTGGGPFHWTDVAESNTPSPQPPAYWRATPINNGADLVTGEKNTGWRHRALQGRYIVYDLGKLRNHGLGTPSTSWARNEYGKNDFDRMIVSRNSTSE
jgi:hypothetical protein